MATIPKPPHQADARVLDRLINILFFFTLVFVFILFGDAADHIRFLIAFLLALLFSIISFVLNWLTLDGAIATIIFGIIAYGLGGITGAGVVLAFFISGSLLSKDLISSEGFLEKKFRRDGIQVWANGFWFALWVIIWFLSGHPGFMVAATASIATATADTWATEVGGNRLKAKARLITTWEKVPPGTDGAISLYGTFAALAGTVLVTAIFWGLEFRESISSLIIIISTGFAGCFIDSFLGARFQNRTYRIPVLAVFGNENLYVSNNFVNWLSAGIASVISLALILSIGV